ncbi:hypothetical protein ACFE04_022736 [Oxalis oulophora]
MTGSHHQGIPTKSLPKKISLRVPNNEARQSWRDDWMTHVTLAYDENDDGGCVAHAMTDGNINNDSTYLFLWSDDLLSETYQKYGPIVWEREKTNKVVLNISW